MVALGVVVKTRIEIDRGDIVAGKACCFVGCHLKCHTDFISGNGIVEADSVLRC